jgi:putative FmdB family regulatory protein
MSVYEYVCMGCEARVERLHGMSEREPACPSCGEDRVRRRLSLFAAGSTGSTSGGGGCACGGACACRA